MTGPGTGRLPIALAEMDLATGESCGLPQRVITRVLVRHGDRVLGESTFAAGEAADPEAVRRRCVVDFSDLIWPGGAPPPPPSPFDAGDVSVVVCTRDRADLLAGCLQALRSCDPPPGEILVIDSASCTDETRATAAAHGIAVHRLDAPGLNRARNRGWHVASGAIVVYVDDDARVDPRAMSVVARTMFDPAIGTIAGLVLPAEIETDAQRRFERRLGMAKGFQRRIFDPRSCPVGLRTYEVGVGALMAFRRTVLEAVGGFDPSLDVGTATRGGGDLDGFKRVLDHGACIVYEPSFLARHVHRRDHPSWVRQMVGYGYGYTAYLEAQRQRGHIGQQERRAELIRWHAQRRGVQLVRAVRQRQLSDLIELTAEGYGSLFGARAYRTASGTADEGRS